MSIVALKTVAGEEIIATFDSEDATSISVSKPRLVSLVRNGQGVGISLFPCYLTAGDEVFKLQKSALITWISELTIPKDIADGYKQEVSPIAVATGAIAQSILATP